jgi:branched-chain amino acid transport system ATP-binding protein
LPVPAAETTEAIRAPGRGGPVLAVNEVTVRFGGINALTEVSLEANAGEITGLIGPNGAGKTTTFNVITGLERPAHGSVRILGVDAGPLRPHRRARLGLARTFQRLEVFGSLSVRDNILAGAEFHRSWSRSSFDPRQLTDAVLAQVGLEHVAHLRVDSVPTGTARLVELGRALATRPRLLLLDEPGSGLDESETEGLGRLLVDLAASGIAVLLVEHDVGLVMSICHRVFVLNFGAIIASGTAAEIQKDPTVQAAYLGGAPDTAGAGS